MKVRVWQAAVLALPLLTIGCRDHVQGCVDAQMEAFDQKYPSGTTGGEHSETRLEARARYYYGCLRFASANCECTCGAP
jgi:hypothetical protein